MRKRKETLIFLVVAIICLILSLIPATQGITIGKVGPLFRTLSIIFGILFVADIVAYILTRKKK